MGAVGAVSAPVGVALIPQVFDMMHYIPDLIVGRPNETPVAAVEVKGAGPLSPERAQGIFESYLAAVGQVRASYFMVVSPQKGFLWKIDALRPDRAANAEFDMNEVFGDYLNPKDDAEVPRGRTLEFVVFHWLLDVALGVRKPHTAVDEQLQQAGFTDSIRNAEISFGLAA